MTAELQHWFAGVRARRFVAHRDAFVKEMPRDYKRVLAQQARDAAGIEEPAFERVAAHG